jgi:hypothetical protein
MYSVSLDFTKMNNTVENTTTKTSAERCQLIYWNLIESLESGKESDANSTMFIREFFQTQRCDEIHDLRSDRTAYVKFMGPGVVERILAYQQTDLDMERGAQAVYHYTKWNHRQLVRGLDWPNWLYYHTLHQPTRLVECIAIGGTAYGGARLAINTMKLLKSRRSFSAADPIVDLKRLTAATKEANRSKM